jgi:hypothetical protein
MLDRVKILSAIELYFDQNDGVWKQATAEETPEQVHPRWKH